MTRRSADNQKIDLDSDMDSEVEAIAINPILVDADHGDAIDELDYAEELREPEMVELLAQLGNFFDRFGFKRNVGRIWAVIYLAPQPLTQAEVSELVGLSAGMVSSSLRDLVHYGAIRVVHIRGTRSTKYEAEEKLLRIVSTILAKREVEAVRRLRDTARMARMSYRPPEYGDTFEHRLQNIERLTDLYESFAKLVMKMSRLPTAAIEQTMRVVDGARFLEDFVARAAVHRKRKKRAAAAESKHEDSA